MSPQFIGIFSLILTSCTLGSSFHEKKYLSKEKFMDLNKVPPITLPDQKAMNLYLPQQYEHLKKDMENQKHSLEESFKENLEEVRPAERF